MKCIVINEFGDPSCLKQATLEVPHILPRYLLVKLHATSINPLDCRFREGHYKSFVSKPFPWVLGMDVAGEVVSIGSQVKHFRIDDRVLARMIDLPGGTYAEYVLVPERICSLMPQAMDYKTAGALPHAGLTALQALRDHLHVRPEDHVLIHGGSGGVGHLAVQLAKVMRATVTTTAAESNVEWLTLLGIDHVIEHEALESQDSEYDAIFDASGHLPWHKARPLLKSQGRYVTTKLNPTLIFSNFFETLFTGMTVGAVVTRSSRMDLDYLSNLVVQQKLRVQIDRTFKLSQVKAAHQYQAEKKGVGKIAISIIADD